MLTLHLFSLFSLLLWLCCDIATCCASQKCLPLRLSEESMSGVFRVLIRTHAPVYLNFAPWPKKPGVYFCANILLLVCFRCDKLGLELSMLLRPLHAALPMCFWLKHKTYLAQVGTLFLLLLTEGGLSDCVFVAMAAMLSDWTLSALGRGPVIG